MWISETIQGEKKMPPFGKITTSLLCTKCYLFILKIAVLWSKGYLGTCSAACSFPQCVLASGLPVLVGSACDFFLE